MKRTLWFLILSLLAVGQPLRAQVWAGWIKLEPKPSVETADDEDLLVLADRAWQVRGLGHEGEKALPGPIDEAIELYERALSEEPESLECHWGLLRALYFRGEFAASGPEERLAAHARGKEVADAAFALLPAWPEDREQIAEVAPLLAEAPDAAEVVFWGSLAWGAWGDSVDQFTALRNGVGGQLRMLTELTVAIDPEYADAGGHRIQGRLHAVAPKVPFFTGWVDREFAVAELRRAVEIAPHNADNLLFLAEALLDHVPGSEAEARELLERAARAEKPPEAAVEHARALKAVEERLADLDEAG